MHALHPTEITKKVQFCISEDTLVVLLISMVKRRYARIYKTFAHFKHLINYLLPSRVVATVQDNLSSIEIDNCYEDVAGKMSIALRILRNFKSARTSWSTRRKRLCCHPMETQFPALALCKRMCHVYAVLSNLDHYL